MAANKDEWHRNLMKSELGGVIIGCTNDTMREGLSSQVFGLSTERIAYVQNIEEGLPLFFFNYDDRTLHGIYEAASSDRLEIDSEALTGGKDPVQVQIRVRRKYQPLAEHQFKHIIADNYYNGKDFQFELDRTQARRLMSYFPLMQYSPKSYLELLEEINENMKELKASKQDYDLKVASLDTKMVEAGQQINQLENICLQWEPASIPPSVTLAADESRVDSSRFNLDLDQSIFIVGGTDGEHCLSTLYSFSPSNDELRSHKSMSSIRAHASVAKIDRELYVLGGHSCARCHNAVESYNPRNDCWTPRPSLQTRRYHLAAATLNGKVFAIGGRQGVEYFSSVEIFDPNVGTWGWAGPMLENRYCLAAVELNGAIYAVGGYGRTICKSAERYDPREDSWRRIGDMHTQRGYHSLVVLNEKLYAIGGCDGTDLLSSVEIYDPRLDTWMVGEPMNQARGYAVAAVVNNESIYVIGGTKSYNDDSPYSNRVDVIECYKEDQGWEATTLRAVGKKCCYASGIVLGED